MQTVRAILFFSKFSLPPTSTSSSSPGSDGDDSHCLDGGLNIEYIQSIVDLPTILETLATRFEAVRISQGAGSSGEDISENGDGDGRLARRWEIWEVFTTKMRHMKVWFENKLSASVDVPTQNASSSSPSSNGAHSNDTEFGVPDLGPPHASHALPPVVGVGVCLDPAPGIAVPNGMPMTFEFDDVYWHEIILDWCSF
jgi:hypothetical protein